MTVALSQVERAGGREIAERQMSGARVKWEDLWKRHLGATCLVLGAGPSANMIDHKKIGCDFVIGANYVHRKHHVDYQVSVDGCVWHDTNRPKNVKLLAGYVDAHAIPAAERAGAYCAFPHCGYGWGYFAQGKPLPSAYNSGIGAIAMAYYMGCRHIKILGIDFSLHGGSVHCYDDPPGYSKRVEPVLTKSIFPRNQMHLAFLLLQLHTWTAGAVVENYSPLYDKSKIEFNLIRHLQRSRYRTPNVFEKAPDASQALLTDEGRRALGIKN